MQKEKKGLFLFMFKYQQGGVEEKDHWNATREKAVLNVHVGQIPALKHNVANC